MKQIGKTKSMFYAFILVLIFIISICEPGVATADASYTTLNNSDFILNFFK